MRLVSTAAVRRDATITVTPGQGQRQVQVSSKIVLHPARTDEAYIQDTQNAK